MNEIKLIALDLDGTLFDNKGIISAENIDAIKKATASGIHVVISTGRPLMGIPLEQIRGTGIQYAITTNGSAIYDIITGECLFENPLDDKVVFPIIRFLLTKDIHMDAFCAGKGYTPEKCRPAAMAIEAPESLKKYILNTRLVVPDLISHIRSNHLHIQKMTLNFHPDQDGTLIDREEVRRFLISNPDITVVCGGYNNLEFSKKGVDKGLALLELARILDVSFEQTMAIGDTENDLAIIRTAALGVAMGNATDEVKAQADFITLSNTENGVAHAINKFALNEF